MSLDGVILVVNSAGVVMVGAGLIATWVKNGKEQRSRDQEIAERQANRDRTLQLNQENIIKRLDDKDNGLHALSNKINDMKNHCSEISSAFRERLGGHDRELKEVKNNMKRSQS